MFERWLNKRFRGQRIPQNNSGYNVEEDVVNKEIGSDGFVEYLQLGLEEAFYLAHALKCLEIKDEVRGCIQNVVFIYKEW